MITRSPWTRLHRSPAAFSQLRPTWEGLFNTADQAVPFTHPAWSEAWWSVYGRRRELAILEVGDASGTLLVAPFQVSTVPGTGLRRLEFLGGGPATVRDWLRNPRGQGLASTYDVLVRPDSRHLVAGALASCVDGLGDEIDAVRLTAVPAGSPVLGTLDRLEPAWTPALDQDTGRRFRIDVSVGWDEFRAGLSKRQRKDLRYKVNELERAAAAPLELVIRDRGPELAIAMDEFMELHLRRWRARGKPGLLPGEAEFYRALVAARAPLVVFRLMAGTRLIASQFGLRAGRRYAPYNFAFDPALKEQSPSNVLMQLVIQHGCRGDLESIELVPPMMARHWQPQDLAMRELRFTQQSPLGRVRSRLTQALEGAIVSLHANPVGVAARSRAAALAARRTPSGAYVG